MKILITGASGLVGKNLVEIFKNTSHNLLTPSHGELDLMNRSEVYKYLELEKPDAVIHCAAKVGSIAENFSNPLQFLLANFDMSRNVIIGAFDNGIKKFINLASACVYPAEKYNELLTEDMAVTGSFEKENEGYSLAKAAGLLMCKYISEKNSDFHYKTLIPCNIYGGGCKASFSEKKSHMLEAAIKKIYKAKKENLPEVEIWGNGKPRRELIYAEDLAKIIFHAVENLEKVPAVLNVGSGKDYSVDDCYKTVAKILDYKGKFFYDLSKPSGMQRRLLDVPLLRSLDFLNLKSETSLEEGIKKTVEFYKNYVL